MKRIILIILGILIIVGLALVIYDLTLFASGVNEDTKRRNEIIDKKKSDIPKDTLHTTRADK